MTDTTGSLQRKIVSASDLQSVVRTMKSLAAASIGQFEASIAALHDYYRSVELGFAACLRELDPGSPFSANHVQASPQVGAIVFGSDQSLVGQFNELIANYAATTLQKLPGQPQIWAIGDRVQSHLINAGLPVRGVLALPNSVRAIAPLVTQIQLATDPEFLHDGIATVYVFRNRPLSSAQYEPTGQRLLPLDAEWRQDLARTRWPTRQLPQVIGDPHATLRVLLHEYLFISLFRACAESLAAENASRLAAMERAEKNIDDVLTDLRSEFHRLRQNTIDAELFDVISGFEALGGGK